MTKNVFWASFFAFVAAILQSGLFIHLSIFHAVPDLALGIIVYSAYMNGVMTGQLSGFFSGLVIDFLSASPLGLNALVRTILGALTGLLKGAFFLDSFLLPMVLCAAATLAKALALFLLHFLFPNSIVYYTFATPTLWLELLYNSISAPFLFFFLKGFKQLLLGRKENM